MNFKTLVRQVSPNRIFKNIVRPIMTANNIELSKSNAASRAVEENINVSKQFN